MDTVGWRMIFIVTLCILAAALLFAFLCFDDVLDTEIRKFDVLSFVLSAFAFGDMTLGIGNISRGITKPEAFVPLFIGVIGSICFVYRQLHIKQPFLELRVFSGRQFTISVLGSMFLYLIMMGGSVIMPIYVQTILGKSATISGLATLPGSLAMTIVSPLAGKIYDKLGMKKLAVGGTIGLPLYFISHSSFQIIKNIFFQSNYLNIFHYSLLSDFSFLIFSLIIIGKRVNNDIIRCNQKRKPLHHGFTS